MTESRIRIRRSLAAVLSAAVIGVVGVGAISPETAQAAGVVVEHRSWGATTTAAALGEREDA